MFNNTIGVLDYTDLTTSIVSLTQLSPTKTIQMLNVSIKYTISLFKRIQ